MTLMKTHIKLAIFIIALGQVSESRVQTASAQTTSSQGSAADLHLVQQSLGRYLKERYPGQRVLSGSLTCPVKECAAERSHAPSAAVIEQRAALFIELRSVLSASTGQLPPPIDCDSVHRKECRLREGDVVFVESVPEIVNDTARLNLSIAQNIQTVVGPRIASETRRVVLTRAKAGLWQVTQFAVIQIE